LKLPPERQRILEAAFAAVFSVAILLGFYQLLSMNGLVLGNDPSVHLEKAMIFLRTGQIPLDNLGWTPPLFSILLAVFIAFTNASTIGQLIVVVKVLAVLIDWLLFFSVYLLSSKFFGRRVGATAAVLLLICFPMYEVNMFGGYTTVLALAVMFLIFLYTPLATTHYGYLVVTFFAAFALVLSHQLAAFLAVFIMPLILLFMLIKSKGAHLKVGGGIAFFLYYIQAMLPYLDVLIYYVFFGIETYAYQIPSASFDSFMINFGFVLLLATGGITIAYYQLKTSGKLILYLILALSFFVPLFFAESYLFGLYLPFQWFIYYLMPPMAILAAVATVFIFDKTSALYIKNKTRVKKGWVKALAVILVFLAAATVLFRFGTVYGRIMEASVYYSTSDPKALEAGLWLKNNFPGNSTVVVTEVPGYWFKLFSDKPVIAATDPIIQRMEKAESVLDLSYEVEQPFTLLRSYEAKGAISFENYVSINDVWSMVSYASGDGDKVNYTLSGVSKEIALSNFTRDTVFDDGNPSPKRLLISYVNDDLALTETITVRNVTYPTEISWTVTPLNNDVSAVSLYMSVFFGLQFHFEKAYVPGVLNWENPWSKPSQSQGTNWAVVDFVSKITDYVGFYSDKEDIVYALKFEQPPDWGNVGALTSRQIDAVRMQYNFTNLGMSQNASVAYHILTFSKSSFPEMPSQPIDVRSLFNLEPAAEFLVASRDYHDYIKSENIGFIVYDKNQLDTKIIRCKILELVYSNDRYIIFKIKNTT
jgi:hypothetical protein